MHLRKTLTLPLLLALAGGALAQNGADDCGNATPIAGTGTFAFDNNGATIDGPADCSGQPVRKDIWYVWTCPTNGGYTLSTCNQTSLPTRIAAYDGADCGNLNLIGCSSQFCGNQSQLNFTGVAGNQYLMRIGSRQVGSAGSGTFSITDNPCLVSPDDGFEDNDDCTSATAMTDGSYPGLHVKKVDPDWYAFEIAPGSTLQVDVFFTHLDGDIDIFLFDGCSGGVQIASSGSATNNEALSYTNNDTCDITVYLRVEHWLPDTNSECVDYDMTISGSGGSGTPCDGGGVVIACDPANNHSGGVYAQIAGTGTLDSGDAFPLHLEVTDGPSGEFGYFLASATLVDPGIPVSQGMLCVGSPQVRYSPTTATNDGNPAYNSIGQFDGSGVYQNLPGTSTVGSGFDVPNSLPSPINATIQPGETWTFQVWYRDGADSNFSTAASVTFQ